jgi:hypothetical protein
VGSSDPMEIRSYRAVFDLERRIYRIDRLRLNPGGVPVRGAVYFIVLLLVTAAIGSLPLVGESLRLLPWYVRDLALPAGSAALLTIIRVEGRPFHLAVRSLGRYAAGPRCTWGLNPCTSPGRCWRPPDLLLLPDGSDGRLRGMRFTGPGAVLVAAPHERVSWSPRLLDRLWRRPHITLRELPQRRESHLLCGLSQRPQPPRRRAPSSGQVIELRAGALLEVRPAPAACQRPAVPEVRTGAGSACGPRWMRWRRLRKGW